jgi:hypothetical protein
MLHINISLGNPFSRFIALLKSYEFIFWNNILEIEIYKTTTIIGVGLNVTLGKQYDKGFSAKFSLLGYELVVMFYHDRYNNVDNHNTGKDNV